MYSQIAHRVLLGGHSLPSLYANMIDRANVTHIVNMREGRLEKFVEDQFNVLNFGMGEKDFPLDATLWFQLMNWVGVAYQDARNVLYFHERQNTESPVACYAALRSFGYSAMQSRRLIENARPVTKWYDHAMSSVDVAYSRWCIKIGKNPELRRSEMMRSLRESAIHIPEVMDDNRETALPGD